MFDVDLEAKGATLPFPATEEVFFYIREVLVTAGAPLFLLLPKQ
jgi:hypothetical protein